MKLIDQTPEQIIAHVEDKYPTVMGVLNIVAARVEVNKRAIAPYQAAALFQLVSERQPKRILEIGTALGYSAAVMASAAPEAQVITLNPNAEEAAKARKALVYYPNVEVIEAKSWDYLRVHQGLTFDLIFVDGDHNRVRADLPWYDLLSPGGLMLFHDYSPADTPRPCPPVYAAVNEFAELLQKEIDVLIVDDTGVGMAGFVRGEQKLSESVEGKLILAGANSHCTLDYLQAIYQLAEGYRRKQGAIVECGVSNGGSAAVLAMGASRAGRKVYLFDNFEGMPAADPKRDGPKAAAKAATGDWCKGNSMEAQNLVQRLDEKAGVVLGVGPFDETLGRWQQVHPEKVAILHVDATLYHSTKLALETFYDDVIEGGLIIVGAYLHWQGVKAAVDEFRKAHKIEGAMLPVDVKGVAWRKGG